MKRNQSVLFNTQNQATMNISGPSSSSSTFRRRSIHHAIHLIPLLTLTTLIPTYAVESETQPNTNNQQPDLTYHTYQHTFKPHQEEYDVNIFDPTTMFGAPYGGYARASRSRLASLPLRLVGGAAAFDIVSDFHMNDKEEDGSKKEKNIPYFSYRDGEGQKFVCRIYDEDELHYKSVLDSMFNAAVLADEEYTLEDEKEEEEPVIQQPDEVMKKLEKVLGSGKKMGTTSVVSIGKEFMEVDGINRPAQRNNMPENDASGQADIPQSANMDDGQSSSSSSPPGTVSSSTNKKQTLVYKNDILESLNKLKGLCSQYHDGYWSYEWCHETTVVQFHVRYNLANVKNVMDNDASQQQVQPHASVEQVTVLGKWKGLNHRKVLVEKKDLKDTSSSSTDTNAANEDTKTSTATNKAKKDDEFSEYPAEQQEKWSEQRETKEKQDAARRKSMYEAKKRRDERKRAMVGNADVVEMMVKDDGTKVYDLNKDKTAKHSSVHGESSSSSITEMDKSTPSSSAKQRQRKAMHVVDTFDGGEFCDEVKIFRSMEVNLRCCEESEVNPPRTHEKKIRPYSTTSKEPMAVFMNLKEEEVCKYTATICTNVLCSNAFQPDEEEAGDEHISNEDTRIITNRAEQVLAAVKEDIAHAQMDLQEVLDTMDFQDTVVIDNTDLPPNPSLKDIADAAAAALKAKKNGGIQRRDKKEKRHVFKRDDPVEYILDTTLRNKCIEYHDDGWWTYVLCYKQSVVQYHEEKIIDSAHGQIKSEIETKYELGKYNSKNSGKIVLSTELSTQSGKKSALEQDILTDLKKNEAKDKYKKVGASSPEESSKPYFSQEYTGGDVCDDSDVTDYTQMKDGIERATSVRFFCGNQLALTGINEDSTCHYIVDVSVPELCAHKDFVTPQVHTQVVKCLPASM